MYPFTNSTLNPAAMMNSFNTTTANRGAAPSFRNTSIGSGNMMHRTKVPRHGGGNISIVIRPNDVLCGRGKTSFNHSGNRRFRHIISQSIEEYGAANSKWEKSLVAARLVSVIHASGGRFLKQKKENEDEWYELSSSESKSKVSHAIRDAIAATKPSRRPSVETRPVKAPAVTSSSSKEDLMDDSSDRTASTVGMDESDKSANGFVRPQYRGTWSSNSLVSLTDDSDAKETTAKPDLATSRAARTRIARIPSKVNERWSIASEDDEGAERAIEPRYKDDFASYIHNILGPNHP